MKESISDFLFQAAIVLVTVLSIGALLSLPLLAKSFSEIKVSAVK